MPQTREGNPPAGGMRAEPAGSMLTRWRGRSPAEEPGSPHSRPSLAACTRTTTATCACSSRAPRRTTRAGTRCRPRTRPGSCPARPDSTCTVSASPCWAPEASGSAPQTDLSHAAPERPTLRLHHALSLSVCSFPTVIVTLARRTVPKYRSEAVCHSAACASASVAWAPQLCLLPRASRS